MKVLFCSGSSTSRSADEGSPRKSTPILSTSSSRNTGLLVPAFLRHWMIFPGSAPMYVLLWPRISASSLTPPREILTNFLPSALAIDFAREVLPTPGGPTKQRIGPFSLLTSFRTARYSRMRSLTFSSP